MKVLQSIKNPFVLIYSFVVFFIPLIFVTNTKELFEFPKTIFFYVFTLVNILLFIFVKYPRVKLNKESFLRNRINIFILIYVLTFVLSTSFSSNVVTSVFGYYSRFNDNLLSILSLLLFYFIGINVLNKKDTENLFKILIFSSLMVSIYGLFQFFGGSQWGYRERIFSTFGQPNWLAQFLSILLPLITYYIFEKKENDYFLIFIYLLDFLCLWLTYSLSGIFGYFLSMFIFILIIHKSIVSSLRRGFKENYHYFIKLSFVFIFPLIFMLVFPGMFRDKIKDGFYDVSKFISETIYPKDYSIVSPTTDVLLNSDKSINLTNSVNSINSTNLTNSVNSGDVSTQKDILSNNVISDPGFIRLGLWEGSFNLYKSSIKVILLGIGPETFPFEFQFFRTSSLNYSSEWDYVFNKPHNYYVEVLVEQGIFSLTMYLIILITIFKKLPTKYIPSFVSFMFTNIFGWPVIAISIIFWMFLMLVSYEFKDTYERNEKDEKDMYEVESKND